MIKNQECYDHMLPPEQVELPQALVEIKYDNVIDKDVYTAEALNKQLEWVISYMHKAELDCPVYLNGQEWDGLPLTDEEVMAL